MGTGCDPTPVIVRCKLAVLLPDPATTFMLTRLAPFSSSVLLDYALPKQSGTLSVLNVVSGP